MAALAVVVYLSFLKPGDSGSLSGIAVEDGAQTEVFQVPREQRRRIPAPDARKVHRQAHETPTVTTESLPATETPAPTYTGPVDVQYTGAVEQIVTRVRRDG